MDEFLEEHSKKELPDFAEQYKTKVVESARKRNSLLIIF